MPLIGGFPPVEAVGDTSQLVSADLCTIASAALQKQARRRFSVLSGGLRNLPQ